MEGEYSGLWQRKVRLRQLDKELGRLTGWLAL